MICLWKTVQETTRIEDKAHSQNRKKIEESIQLALRSKSIDQTAEDLGIPISTLHGWIHRLSRKQGSVAFVKEGEVPVYPPTSLSV